MKLFIILSVTMVLIVIGLLLYPSIRLLVGYIDTTGFLPLTAAAVTAFPYIFLLFIVYAIMRVARK